MDEFGPLLRRMRNERGLSLRDLANLVSLDFSYISQIERGVRPGSLAIAAACDRALNADGRLVSAFEQSDAETDMQRRTVLRALGALVGAGSPLVSLEALRQGLGQALDADYDDWQQIAADYGLAFYTTPADTLIEQIGADLRVIQEMLAIDRGAHSADLARAAARLSVVLAMCLVATGQLHMARRFWRSAARAALQSGDPDTQVLVAAWDAVNGCYDGRGPHDVLRVADTGAAYAGRRATAAAAGLHAARAQALALSGRADDARDAVATVASLTERLPGEQAANPASLWAWPEHRLRHTQSYVYTHAGDLKAAAKAQDRALVLYPPSQARLRTQVELHRASCMIRAGHVSDGLRHAADLLDQLPTEQHNVLLREVARQVVAAVPQSDQQHREAVGLRERLPEIGA